LNINKLPETAEFERFSTTTITSDADDEDEDAEDEDDDCGGAGAMLFNSSSIQQTNKQTNKQANYIKHKN
jgi:hypothetical protein